MVLRKALRTLNSRVCYSNPVSGSIYSFNGVYLNLILSKKPADPRLSRKLHNKKLTGSNGREFHESCFMTWWPVVCRETLVEHWLTPIYPQPYDDMSIPPYRHLLCYGTPKRWIVTVVLRCPWTLMPLTTIVIGNPKILLVTSYQEVCD